MKLKKLDVQHLGILINYVYKDEQKHFEESPSDDHIFKSIEHLHKGLEKYLLNEVRSNK